MIDPNAIFDEDGWARLGETDNETLQLRRHADGSYSLVVSDGERALFTLSKDDGHDLAVALVRLFEVSKSSP